MTPLWRVSVRAREDAAELLRATLLALAPAGLEELDVGDEVELAAYVCESDVGAALERLPGAKAEPVQEGWENAWRSFHRPVEVEGLWIGPPWESPPDRSRAVLIDPGRAFGTGAHPTTRLCVALLSALSPRGSFLDVGCGSGVLAIAAARLGFAPVVAVDNDPVAVEATLANAAANGVAVEALVLDATRGTLPTADVAVANVLLGPVEVILARLDARLAVTSGYLVTDAVRAPDWERVERRELEGWAADSWASGAKRQNRLRHSTV